MAGSYNHVVDEEGDLVDAKTLAARLDTPGDVYEAIEEMYGMIWWLASDRPLAVRIAQQKVNDKLLEASQAEIDG